jgi:hypothetical protein
MRIDMVQSSKEVRNLGLIGFRSLNKESKQEPVDHDTGWLH